ncbi:MAG: M20/M25/M40 family metallo-hydrolase [Planctomycetes bacterium]|nr:M20/M25/M40 family metallo-hydrolase [Planctomycetota bacterium]
MRSFVSCAALVGVVVGIASGVHAFGAHACGETRPGDAEPESRRLARELSGFTRLAGTSGSVVGAEWAKAELERAGFSVELDEREVLLSYPREIRFAIFAGSASTRPEHERGERFDPNALPPGDVPLYNAWGKSGRVRAAVVDAGRGLRADFERLKAVGVDVTGKVVLARYGGAYRGVKPELAAEYGAAAVLLWTPASDDGAAKGALWPDGPWKPGHEAQRGSILSMARIPGDPSTPGTPSPRPGEPAARVTGAALDALLPSIPCVPIGADEATLLRERLARDTQGKEPLGPGPVEVALTLDAPRELRRIVNVIGTLEGASDELVLAGAHRDAWVRGMNDNASGVVTLLRAAARLGERARSGWRPKATLRIAFWDAEEFGLVGSSEYGEAHADELARRARLYVNTDSGCSGIEFHAGGSPGLVALLKRALERVEEPRAPHAASANDVTATNARPRTLLEQWTAKEPNPALGFPGSGSDFAVFLHHLSVPVVDVGFGGNGGGQYHTAFDDFALADRFLDPGWVGHELAGEFLAELLAQASDAPDAIFDPTEAAHALAGAAREPARIERLGAERAEALASAFERLAAAPNADARRWFYARLATRDGLAGRTWFKNRLWAPGLETGYSAELFPSLALAARAGAETVDRELADLVRAIDALVADP